MAFYVARKHWLRITVPGYKSRLIMPIDLEFFQPEAEIFQDIYSKNHVAYSENFNILIRVLEICLKPEFQVHTVFRKDKFRLQAYSSNGTSTSAVT
jgi:hypothetical protein